MQGYDVMTSDDKKVGQVVGVAGTNLIVERGSILKSRRPLPRAFAHVDDERRIVRTTISKELFETAPKLDGEPDERAINQHYGLAGGFEDPPTQGYGEVLPDDPAGTAEEDAERAGLEPAPAASVRIREEMRPGEAPAAPESPGLLGSREPPPHTD